MLLLLLLVAQMPKEKTGGRGEKSKRFGRKVPQKGSPCGRIREACVCSVALEDDSRRFVLFCNYVKNIL